MRFSRFLALYRRHFRDHRRERMVLASASFFVTFAATRMIVHGFRTRPEPFQLWLGGIHIHHYVWGILLLLGVGYLWLIQLGTGMSEDSHRLGRFTALLYGAGAALTLDEFALWLHLEDVYWERTGRASIDAVILFGALVSVGVWGGPFWRAMLRQGARLVRHGARAATQPSGAGALAAAQVVEQILMLAPTEAVPATAGAELVGEPATLAPQDASAAAATRVAACSATERSRTP